MQVQPSRPHGTAGLIYQSFHQSQASDFSFVRGFSFSRPESINNVFVRPHYRAEAGRTVPRPTAPPLRFTPGDPQPYLETYRLVAFYGSPPGPILGVLGAAPREAITERLRDVAAYYQNLSPDRYVMPAFHMVVTIADPIPGRSGNFNHYMDDDLLEEWITAAGDEGVAVILDVQPGYGDVLTEVERLRPYLYRPHVHLALDSEFTMDGGAIPGQSLGRLFPHHINPTQAMLNEIALENSSSSTIGTGR